jgi:hypothetical protein
LRSLFTTVPNLDRRLHGPDNVMGINRLRRFAVSLCRDKPTSSHYHGDELADLSSHGAL